MPEPVDSTLGDFDPDTPTEAVGSLPAIDLDAIGLPRLGWLFVAGAVLVGALRLRAILEIGADALPSWGPFAIETIAIALLPAALLLRAPDAARTHRPLLAGLAAGAIVEVVRAGLSFVPFFSQGNLYSLVLGPWFGPIDTATHVVGIVGAVLVGLGLVRLLPAPPGRRWLLVVIGVTYLVLTYLPGVAIAAGESLTAGPAMILPATYLVASGFATWVAVVAWLDGTGPRVFWALLAAALPLALAAQLLSVLVGVRYVIWSWTAADAVLAQSLFGLFGLLGATTACLALVAYVRYTPVADGDVDPDRPMIGTLRRLTRR